MRISAGPGLFRNILNDKILNGSVRCVLRTFTYLRTFCGDYTGYSPHSKKLNQIHKLIDDDRFLLHL